MDKPIPIVDPDTKPYWEAVSQKRLILKSCRSCGKPHFYPRELCPHCGSDDLDWIEATGEGEIYSYTVCHRPAGPAFAEDVPYIIAIVTLDEGPRMMTNIIGSPESVAIGRRVKVDYQTVNGQVVLPFFVVADSETAK
jgi:uncharacterized protein